MYQAINAANEAQLQRNKLYVKWADEVIALVKAAGLDVQVTHKASDLQYGLLAGGEQYTIETKDATGFKAAHVLSMFAVPQQVADSVVFFHRYAKATYVPPETDVA